MRSPQSENSSSPLVHSKNLQRELTKLIDHVEVDTRRVDDPRFRGLLEKSAEVLRGLRTLFERYGQRSAASDGSPNARNEGSSKGSARAAGSRARGTAAAEAKPTQKKKVIAGSGGVESGKDQSEKVRSPESAGETNAIQPEPLPVAPKPEDPDEVAARIRLQRKEARSPKMPGGRAAPKPMPPRSGKPVWSRPHSS
jgi:hypothetical protein